MDGDAKHHHIYSKITVVWQFSFGDENAFSIKNASPTLLNFAKTLSILYSMFVPH